MEGAVRWTSHLLALFCQPLCQFDQPSDIVGFAIIYQFVSYD